MKDPAKYAIKCISQDHQDEVIYRLKEKGFIESLLFDPSKYEQYPYIRFFRNSKSFSNQSEGHIMTNNLEIVSYTEFVEKCLQEEVEGKIFSRGKLIQLLEELKPCHSWQDTIIKYINKAHYPENMVIIPDCVILQGLSEANEEQKKILKKYNISSSQNFDHKESKNILRELSEIIFKNSEVIQVLEYTTPKNRPELKECAFYISENYEVEIGQADTGTFVYITKK